MILACGTSYHAGLIGKYVIEELTDMPVRVELASEVNHRDRVVNAQSWPFHSRGRRLTSWWRCGDSKRGLFHIGNYQRSRQGSPSALADRVIYIAAGPEVSVAATKSFIAQLITMYRLILAPPYPCQYNVQSW